MMRGFKSTMIPVAALVAGGCLSGCFATQSDIRVLQSDLGLVRAEAAAADSARRVQLDRVLLSLRSANDSIATLSNRLMRFRSDMTTTMASVDQQLLAIQELTGQSQRRLQEMRTSLEERQGAVGVDAGGSAGGTAGPAGTPPGGPTPGPNQLLQVAREQMMQGSNQAARQAFEDLLAKYPNFDQAADAQFYIAETYAAEGNTNAADSVYARVAATYPKSSRAATALYKRGVAAQHGGHAAQARTFFNEVIKKYPRSDEAALAKDRMKELTQ